MSEDQFMTDGRIHNWKSFMKKMRDEKRRSNKSVNEVKE